MFERGFSRFNISAPMMNVGNLEKPKPKVKTTEDKLFDLMGTYLGCIRK